MYWINIALISANCFAIYSSLLLASSSLDNFFGSTIIAFSSVELVVRFSVPF